MLFVSRCSFVVSAGCLFFSKHTIRCYYYWLLVFWFFFVCVLLWYFVTFVFRYLSKSYCKFRKPQKKKKTHVNKSSSTGWLTNTVFGGVFKTVFFFPKKCVKHWSNVVSKLVQVCCATFWSFFDVFVLLVSSSFCRENEVFKHEKHLGPVLTPKRAYLGSVLTLQHICCRVPEGLIRGPPILPKPRPIG